MYHSVSHADVTTAKKIHDIATRVLKVGHVIYETCVTNQSIAYTACDRSSQACKIKRMGRNHGKTFKNHMVIVHIIYRRKRAHFCYNCTDTVLVLQLRVDQIEEGL